MKQIKPSGNDYQWPRHKVDSVDCRERDLVIRIADWTDDKEEPAFDVEVYIGGMYDWNESRPCTLYEYKTEEHAKAQAIVFAQAQIAKLL